MENGKLIEESGKMVIDSENKIIVGFEITVAEIARNTSEMIRCNMVHNDEKGDMIKYRK